MSIYISGVKGLPEQVQQNKEDIKEIKEDIANIDFDAIRQLESQVGENTQDINNMEASIGVQNQAINGLKDDVDALESKTQKITYNEQSGELTIDSNVNIKRINITASQTPLRADSMVSQDDKNAISLTGANDEISLIVGRSGTQHILNFNADGTLDIDGQPLTGAKIYKHNIVLSKFGGSNCEIMFNIENESSEAFTNDKLKDYINTYHTGWVKGLPASGHQANNIAMFIFATSTTQMNIRMFYISSGGLTISDFSSGYGSSNLVINDTIEEI